jgi:hypothetical protein
MTGERFEVEPVAHVVGGRSEPTDDFWGGTRAVIRIDSTRFGTDATAGLDAWVEMLGRYFAVPPPE